jgi:hypothetical protein
MPPTLLAQLVLLFVPVALLFGFEIALYIIDGSVSGPHGALAGLGSLALLLV